MLIIKTFKCYWVLIDYISCRYNNLTNSYIGYLLSMDIFLLLDISLIQLLIYNVL